jgi:phosphohistidine phosphatase
MKLYIMRHGPAEDHSASGRDGDRSLTASGRERVRSVARLLVDSDEAPLLVLSSPLVRALQTAEIVAAATKLTERGGSIQTRREIEPGREIMGLIRELAAAPKKRVMLVGHEPDLSAVVTALGRYSLVEGMTKSMVVGLHIRDVDGEDSPASDRLGDLQKRVRVRFILEPKEPALTSVTCDLDRQSG